MTSQELANALLEQFGPEVVEEVSSDAIQPWIRISPNKIQEVCSFAKNAPEFAFDFLRSIAGVDYQESIELNYFLFSYPHKHELYIKSRVPARPPKFRAKHLACRQLVRA
ncbi:MAG: NADH-quinone oxidoreductase subunit C [Bdellovibrionota bacterium]